MAGIFAGTATWERTQITRKVHGCAVSDYIDGIQY